MNRTAASKWRKATDDEEDEDHVWVREEHITRRWISNTSQSAPREMRAESAAQHSSSSSSGGGGGLDGRANVALSKSLHKIQELKGRVIELEAQLSSKTSQQGHRSRVVTDGAVGSTTSKSEQLMAIARVVSNSSHGTLAALLDDAAELLSGSSKKTTRTMQTAVSYQNKLLVSASRTHPLTFGAYITPGTARKYCAKSSPGQRSR